MTTKTVLIEVEVPEGARILHVAMDFHGDLHQVGFRLVPPARAVPDEAAKVRVMDAIAAALGDVYDCNRVWEAWHVGTMSADDFSLVTDDSDRLAELADAAIAAIVDAPAEPARSVGDGRIQQAVKELEDILTLRLSPDSTLQQGVYAHGGSNLITAFTRLRESVELVHILLAAAPAKGE